MANAYAGAEIGVALGGFTGARASLNDVNVLVPTHPSLAGSTSVSLSNWGPSAHYEFTAWPVGYTPLAASFTAPSQQLILVRDMSCGP